MRCRQYNGESDSQSVPRLAYLMIEQVTMMSRITLNLRKNMDRSNSSDSTQSSLGEISTDIQLRDLEVPSKTAHRLPELEFVEQPILGAGYHP